MKKQIALILFIFFFLVEAAFAYTSPGSPKGFVNDFAGIFNDSQKSGLETKLSDFQKSTGNEIAVAIVKNLGGDTVENYAVELFKEWGIGQKGKDNGVLLLVATEDRKIRIEVGYGLEGSLTDAQSSWIIKNDITPAFKNSDYYAGINSAIDQIITAVNGGAVPSDSQNYAKGLFGNLFNDWHWFLFILFLPMWLASILARSKSWWLGGVLGGIVGIVIGFIYGFIFTGLISFVLLVPLGLLFDAVVSKAYAKNKSLGKNSPWWIGGGGRGGGGGFGGFGGGGSGGGGSSGSW
ncbi:MAG: TPM domain-containing protein [Candidatus Wolfebacteria bacterium]|nr:TPM domain-containing protein [Candidatus Wolfebacteria bacterium]